MRCEFGLIHDLLYMLPACLYYIGKALEKDPTYMKGVAFKEKILSENSYLQMLALDIFQNWWVKYSWFMSEAVTCGSWGC